MGPRATRNRQGVQKSGSGFIGRLVSSADRTGADILSDVLVHGWPPKPLLVSIKGFLDARMTGESRRMRPMNYC